MNISLPLLGNITPAQFLTEYWQKKPLLIRQAISNFKGLLDANELAGLACEADVQARIIQQKKDKWSVKHGPFDEADFAKLGNKDWTLLVQSVNHYLPEAANLLAQFNFIPHARLDDLMVSYAPTGGGVGAHVDSYDVFLLQGAGRRNWKISTQSDLSLLEGAPLRILKNFKAEQEWVLEAGDMLYLPPQIAHWGVSESDGCMTYSIGFRAPKTQELQHEFLSYLQDNLNAEGLYSDPDLTLQKHPAEIGNAMIASVSEMLQNLTWDNTHVADFLGKYLTEPKSHVVFEASSKISLAVFKRQLRQQPLHLHLASQMLFFQHQFYLNGQVIKVAETLKPCIQLLADKRCLTCLNVSESIMTELAELLYPHFSDGYVVFEM